VFASQVPASSQKPTGSSHGLGLLFRGRLSTEPPLSLFGYPKRRSTSPKASSHIVTPPLRFEPLQRFPARDSGLKWNGLPHRTACAYRFSRPLGAFIRPEPVGLISCRIRSWGSPSRAFPSCAAVRRFRRRSPPDVSSTRRPSRPVNTAERLRRIKPLRKPAIV